jgi:hypothetical protein
MVKVGLTVGLVDTVAVGVMELYGKDVEPMLLIHVNDKVLPLFTEDVLIKLKVPGDVQSTTGGVKAVV